MTCYQTAIFGSSKAGLTTVGYQLIAAGGQVILPRTTAGVEDIGGGGYGAAVQVPNGFIGRITWDTGETTSVTASAELNVPDYDGLMDTIVSAIQQLQIQPERTILGSTRQPVTKVERVVFDPSARPIVIKGACPQPVVRPLLPQREQ